MSLSIENNKRKTILKKNLILVMAYVFFTLMSQLSQGANEDLNLNLSLKKKIMRSQYKAKMINKYGEKFIVYLYAENETSKMETYASCMTGDSKSTKVTTGNYSLYLYDLSKKTFSQFSRPIFKDLDEQRFNLEGSNIIVLPGLNTSDSLLISQFGDCRGDFYEAYGFSKNNKNLKKYSFLKSEISSEFYGRIGPSMKNKNYVLGYVTNNKTYGLDKFILSTSDTVGIINVKKLSK